MSYDEWANACASQTVARNCVLSVKEKKPTAGGTYIKWVKRVYAHGRWYNHMDFREIVVGHDGSIRDVIYGG